VLDGRPRSRKHLGVVSFEGVEEFKKDRNVREPCVADFLAEPANVEPAALVGPPPMRVALEVGVLDMEDPDRCREGLEPVAQRRFASVQGPVKRVADVEDETERSRSVL
jgi:hypothetical protein